MVKATRRELHPFCYKSQVNSKCKGLLLLSAISLEKSGETVRNREQTKIYWGGNLLAQFIKIGKNGNLREREHDECSLLYAKCDFNQR